MDWADSGQFIASPGGMYDDLDAQYRGRVDILLHEESMKAWSLSSRKGTSCRNSFSL